MKKEKCKVQLDVNMRNLDCRKEVEEGSAGSGRQTGPGKTGEQLHPRCVKERFCRSFLPAAIRLFNDHCWHRCWTMSITPPPHIYLCNYVQYFLLGVFWLRQGHILCSLTYIFILINVYFSTPKPQSIFGLHRQHGCQKFCLGPDWVACIFI